jgi:hypothetical protein
MLQFIANLDGEELQQIVHPEAEAGRRAMFAEIRSRALDRIRPMNLEGGIGVDPLLSLLAPDLSDPAQLQDQRSSPGDGRGPVSAVFAALNRNDDDVLTVEELQLSLDELELGELLEPMRLGEAGEAVECLPSISEGDVDGHDFLIWQRN